MRDYALTPLICGPIPLASLCFMNKLRRLPGGAAATVPRTARRRSCVRIRRRSTRPLNMSTIAIKLDYQRAIAPQAASIIRISMATCAHALYPTTTRVRHCCQVRWMSGCGLGQGKVARAGGRYGGGLNLNVALKRQARGASGADEATGGVWCVQELQ